MLAVGLGAIWVEVLKDASLRLLPVDAAEVKRMLSELRGWPLLAGARGTPPASLDAVAEAMRRLRRTALSLNGALRVLEVNPLWVNGDQSRRSTSLSSRSPSEPKGARRRAREKSTEQEELRASVRRFLADRAPLRRVRELMETEDGTDWAVWGQAGTQLGLQGLAIPQGYGGAGYTFAEQAIVLEEFGAALYGGPYLASAVLAATALLASHDEGARRELLPPIASGDTVATLAFAEDDGSWDPGTIRLSAVKDGQAWRLDGRKSFVLDGQTAGLILVAAATDAGLSLFAVAGTAAGLTPDRAAHPGPDPQAGQAGVRRRGRRADRLARRRRRRA